MNVYGDFIPPSVCKELSWTDAANCGSRIRAGGTIEDGRNGRQMLPDQRPFVAKEMVPTHYREHVAFKEEGQQTITFRGLVAVRLEGHNFGVARYPSREILAEGLTRKEALAWAGLFQNSLS